MEDIVNMFRIPKNEIKDNVVVRSTIDQSTTLNIHLDKNWVETEFFKNLSNNINKILPSIKSYERLHRNRINIEISSKNYDMKIIPLIKNVLKEQINSLKAAHRKLFSNYEANKHRKTVLLERNSQIADKNSFEYKDNLEIIKGIKTYNINAKIVQQRIDDFTGLLHRIASLEDKIELISDMKNILESVGEVLYGATKTAYYISFYNFESGIECKKTLEA